MGLFNQVPKWVKSFPIPIDRETLLQLAKASKGSFDKPREMNHSFFNLVPGADLDEVIRRLEEAGWDCSTIDQVNASDKLALTATKKDYRITEQNYNHDLRLFAGLAEQFRIEYDGWFASN